MTRRQVAVVWFVGLGVAALLSAGPWERSVETAPYGVGRTVALTLLRPLAAVSHALGFDRPRDALDAVVGHHGGNDVASDVNAAFVPTHGNSDSSSVHTMRTMLHPSAAFPSATHPLRILVEGDSISGFVGYAMVNLAQENDDLSAHSFYRISSGLERPDFFNWPNQLQQDMATYDPQVVVFMVGGNDNHAIEDAQGNVDSFGTPEWRVEYAHRVDQIMETVHAQKRLLMWVGMPVMRAADFNHDMQVLNSVYQEEATHHRAVFFDSTPMVADESGGFAEYLPDNGGSLTQARAADGIHLTPFGAHRVASALLARIRVDVDAATDRIEGGPK